MNVSIKHEACTDCDKKKPYVVFLISYVIGNVGKFQATVNSSTVQVSDICTVLYFIIFVL